MDGNSKEIIWPNALIQELQVKIEFFSCKMIFERLFLTDANTLRFSKITEHNISFKLFRKAKNNQYQIPPCHNDTL